MTGNHNAMKTADTVFIKNKSTCKNVDISFKLLKENNNKTLNNNKKKRNNKINNTNKVITNKILMTCDEIFISSINNEKDIIVDNITKNKSLIEKIYFQPIIYTPKKRLTWHKTIGSTLPPI